MLDLRPVAPGDAPALHTLLSDPDVARWLRPHGVTEPFTPEECEAIVDRRGEVELDWAVASALWGRGVGTAMGRHALAAAAERGITNLVAYTRADNAASRRVMEKLGLTHERDFEHAGYPHVLYRTIPEGPDHE